MHSNAWITSYGDKVPNIHPDAFVDVSVRIIGDVQVDKGASIWPMAVLRADSAEIRIGPRGAVLDLALLEAPEGHPVLLEEEALISHGAIIHGARIQSRSLVGIGAIILDGALVSTGSIVGAGSVVPPGTEIPPNSFVIGVPGKIIRETRPQERQAIADQVQDLHRKSCHLMSP
jgi:carbonic anhydrase/acetyltransferase-like protein (isoleucine patch superfamily)